MPVTTATNSTPDFSAATATASANRAGSNLAESARSQGDRFLKLLVAQMQNQDPLNPLDNAQVTSQMAQVSTVEGIEKLNATMTTMLTQMQASQAAGLAGRAVLVSGNTLTHDGDMPGAGGYELAAAADAVTVEVRDADGVLVTSLPQGAREAGTQTFSWDGTANGRALPPGQYRFSVVATSAGHSVGAETLMGARVTAVIPGASGVDLALSTGATRALSEIRAFL